jgi:hypothetical protein
MWNWPQLLAWRECEQWLPLAMWVLWPQVPDYVAIPAIIQGLSGHNSRLTWVSKAGNTRAGSGGFSSLYLTNAAL